MSELRMYVTEFFTGFDPMQLDGLTLADCAKVFSDLEYEYPCKMLTISVNQYGYDGGIDMSLIETRLETDLEFQTRLEAQYKENEKRLKRVNNTIEKERKMYEKLKAKFGDA